MLQFIQCCRTQWAYISPVIFIEHAQLVSQVAVGDDVVTIGGIVGRVSKLKDDFLEITIAKDTTITMQKSAIANVLPKGTFEA